jgi:hypothetical protein
MTRFMALFEMEPAPPGPARGSLGAADFAGAPVMSVKVYESCDKRVFGQDGKWDKRACFRGDIQIHGKWRIDSVNVRFKTRVERYAFGSRDRPGHSKK